jgi:hypothetical protein
MTMREKMARAMYVRYCACGELMMTKVQAPAFEDIDPLLRFQLDQYVDAALDALTANPGEDVLAVGADTMPLYPSESGAGNTFTAMIRAIKEGK